MLYELRTYALRPGKAVAYLEVFRDRGLAVVTRHLPLGGYWLVESGRLNHLHHLWIYADMAERDAARASLAADRDWTEGFVPGAFGLIEQQENRLMRLVGGSVALERAVATRRQAHAPPTGSGALFAAGLSAMVFAEAPVPATIASWQVISGALSPAHVGLTEVSAACPGAERHELLRRLIFSPL